MNYYSDVLFNKEKVFPRKQIHHADMEDIPCYERLLRVFSNFLIFFGLQLHHPVPNAILQLAAYVVMCEGFLGIDPRLDLWQKLFFFKQQSIKMDKAEVEKLTGPRLMTPCSATLVNHRTTCGFPQMPLQDSIKLWQRGFFYVKNVDPSHDSLNLLPSSSLLRR
ncbi:hypothetical protein D1007_25489 [Hordeum vulgare]|nr:hypothetical protein D1007_25489 [Hordeum vulgare]